MPAVLELRPSAMTCTVAGIPESKPALEIAIDLNDQQSAPLIDDSLHVKIAIEIGYSLENSRAIYSCQQLLRRRAAIVIERGIGNMI